jgi:DNA-binding MarR family transcriptional regulator
VYILPCMDLPDRAQVAAVRQCACFNLRKAARAVTQLYDGMLRPSGLRATQFSLLMVVRAMSKVSISRLAEEAVMDRTTLTRNLDLLEREGLVRIRPGEDARVREVELTPAAEEKLAAALPYWERAQAEMSKKLGVGRMERLLGDLSGAIAAAER